MIQSKRIVFACHNSCGLSPRTLFKLLNKRHCMIRATAEYQLKTLLMEDVGFGDITSQLLGEEEGSSYIIAKEDCILSGIEYVTYLFETRGLHVTVFFKDGDTVKNGQKILEISGLYKNVFEVERTALNLLTRMSGIATETQKLVQIVKKVNPECCIAATRKTVLRFFDKEAVVTGGGDPHRFRLDDMILLKDNHIKILGIEEAIKRARLVSFSKKVEIEVSTKEDAVTAVKHRADIVMLDNMDPEPVREATEIAKKINPAVIIEASGGITEENITAYAGTGVDVISVGFLTHSVKAVNMSLEVV
jgi:nicotinate-nucleotide pyrophosphorylase (carboxylating)